jgi:hypothetical protein
MMNKNLLLVFIKPLFLIIFCTLNMPLPAQSGQYVIEQRYVQQLVWVEDQYVLKYEVVIEKDEGRGYRAFTREFTEKPNLQISLIPGKYRYQVIPYDYLDQPGGASGWVILNILPSPVIPVEVQATGDDSYLLHSNVELVPGVNEIIINNPGELEIDKGALIVGKQESSGYRRQNNIFLGAAWLPLIPLNGRMQEIFGNEFYFSGVTFNFGMFFNKLKWFNPGVELSTSLYSLNHSQSDYTIKMQAGVIGINFLAQKQLPNPKMALTLRAGAGLGYQIGGLDSGQDILPIGGLQPQLNLELSWLWQFWKKLYLQTGIGYNLLLNQDNSSGCLRPWFGISWNF